MKPAETPTVLPVPEVTDSQMVFGSNPPLPKWEDLPEDFQRGWNSQSHPWCSIPSKWFFKGGSLDEFGLKPKPGVDAVKAMRAIRACLGSWDPKHEHKIAGIGFLLSQWFDRAPLSPTP